METDRSRHAGDAGHVAGQWRHQITSAWNAAQVGLLLWKEIIECGGVGPHRTGQSRVRLLQGTAQLLLELLHHKHPLLVLQQVQAGVPGAKGMGMACRRVMGL